MLLGCGFIVLLVFVLDGPLLIFNSSLRISVLGQFDQQLVWCEIFYLLRTMSGGCKWEVHRGSCLEELVVFFNVLSSPTQLNVLKVSFFILSLPLALRMFRILLQ